MPRGSSRSSTKTNPLKPPSQRQQRVSEEIRAALAHIFERGELRDPAITSTMITVTGVKVSPDLTNATVFVTPLGGGDPKPLIEALTRAQGYIRHEVVKRVDLRQAPKFSFAADFGFDAIDQVEAILRSPQVRRDIIGTDTIPAEAPFEDEEFPEDTTENDVS